MRSTARRLCVPFAVMQMGLAPNTLAVYLTMVAHRNNSTGTAWPSQASIRKMSRVGRHQVGGCLADLVAAGLLVRVGRRGRSGVVEYRVESSLIGDRSDATLPPIGGCENLTLPPIGGSQERDATPDWGVRESDATPDWGVLATPDRGQELYRGNYKAPPSPSCARTHVRAPARRPEPEGDGGGDDELSRDEIRALTQPTTDEARAICWETFPVPKAAVVRCLEIAMPEHQERLNGKATLLTPDVVASLYRVDRCEGLTLDGKPLTQVGRLPKDVAYFAKHVAASPGAFVTQARSLGLLPEAPSATVSPACDQLDPPPGYRELAAAMEFAKPDREWANWAWESQRRIWEEYYATQAPSVVG